MESADREKLQKDLARLSDGDRDAFHPVFVSLLPELRSFAERHLSAEDAADVSQQAMLSLFRRAHEFDKSRDALSWVLGICAWEIRTLRRRRGRRREDLGDAPVHLPGAESSPEDLVLIEDLKTSLEGALGRLPPADREVLLTSMNGTDRPEGIGAAAWRKRLQRAIERVRALWRTEHGLD